MKNFYRIAALFLAFGFVAAFAGCSNASGGGDNPAPTPTTTTYTVSFDANDGSQNPAKATQIFTAGVSQKLTPIAELGFKRDNFVFAGWALSSAASQAAYADEVEYIGNISITLYAVWTPIYTVTFDSKGGSEVVGQKVTSGQTATRPDDPAKDHFNFAGWCSDANCQTPFDFATPIIDNTILYARWSDLPVYVVTFDLNGGKYGSSDTYTQNIEDGSKAMRPASVPTKDDKVNGDEAMKYAFDNWYADSGCGTLFDFDATAISGPTTVYAKWNETKCYAVKIAGDIERGSVSSDATEHVAAGTLVTLTASPIPGYDLSSYTVTDADSNPVAVTNGKFTMPAGPVTVSATFVAIEYTITCGTPENGTVTADLQKATIGMTVTLTVAANSGYELKTILVKDSNGTNVSVTEITAGAVYTFIMPAGNITVTADFRVVGTNDPLTLEATSASTKVTFKNQAEGPVTYRVNGGAAQTIASGSWSTITLSKVGDKVSFYGDNAAYATSDSVYSNINCDKYCYVYGNIMSLVDSQNYENATALTKSYTFAHLFYDNEKIKNKSGKDLILPATTLADSCYSGMFSGCSSLASAPELPAMTLADRCYSSMFWGCSSLASAPRELPATTLADSCYSYMFYGCTGLTAAPELPATTLADSCYYCMFKNCTRLVIAPKLPATTLADSCYSNMFNGCARLVSAPPELPATTLADSCYSSMFSGCTSLWDAPKLPATTLAKSCYYFMFNGCASLANAPKLPATTLADSCYSNMFNGCTRLAAPKLPATTLAKSCYLGMFYGCTGLTAAPELPATTLADSCYSGMFSGCSSLASAPKLPATTLAKSCYSGMFRGCTSLASAPELPATTLTDSCYSDMFSACSNLSSVTCLATDISADSCTLSWLYCVSSSGTFKKSKNMTDWSRGSSDIPYNWTVVDYQE